MEIIPGLSTWTAEDLVEAGGWDEELAKYTDSYEDEEIVILKEDD